MRSRYFIQIHEIEHQYPCYVDIRAIVEVDEALQLITFHNKTTLQLTPEAFERVIKSWRELEFESQEDRLCLSSI